MSRSEKWMPIPGYEGVYEASDAGRIRRTGRKALKGRSISRSGALGVSLCVNGNAKTMSIHSLIAKTFIGDRPENLVVCHMNGDPTDNRLSNLKYATHKENMAHKLNHGTAMRSHLSPRQICEIREWKGCNPSAAEKYGVSVRTVQNIKSGDVWTNVSQEMDTRHTMKLRAKKAQAWVEDMENADLIKLQKILEKEILKRSW